MVFPAKKRYDKKNIVRYTLALNRSTDSELIEKMEAQESRNQYLKDLIRADIEKEKGPQ